MAISYWLLFLVIALDYYPWPWVFSYGYWLLRWLSILVIDYCLWPFNIIYQWLLSMVISYRPWLLAMVINYFPKWLLIIIMPIGYCRV
jgi:hypothetical protein